MIQAIVAGVVLLRLLVVYGRIGMVPDVVIPALLIVPILYAALWMGFAGSAATTVWTLIVSIPDLVVDGLRDRSQDIAGDLVIETIVLAVGIFVSYQTQKERVLVDTQRAVEADRRRIVERFAGDLLSAHEEEQRRIAQELHDETLQTLIQLKRKIATASRAEDDSAATGPPIHEAAELAERSIRELRDLVRGMRPAVLEDLGLERAVASLAENASGPDLAVTFDGSRCGPGELKGLSSHSQLVLYRIAQEALTNVRQHASASRAAVTLAVEDGAVVLNVSDNGLGFQPPMELLPPDSIAAGAVHSQRSPRTAASAPPNLAGLSSRGVHLGLLGMYERASLAGGDVRISSAPAGGTRVSVRIPHPLSSGDST